MTEFSFWRWAIPLKKSQRIKKNNDKNAIFRWPSFFVRKRKKCKLKDRKTGVGTGDCSGFAFIYPAVSCPERVPTAEKAKEYSQGKQVDEGAGMCVYVYACVLLLIWVFGWFEDTGDYKEQHVSHGQWLHPSLHNSLFFSFTLSDQLHSSTWVFFSFCENQDGGLKKSFFVFYRHSRSYSSTEGWNIF